MKGHASLEEEGHGALILKAIAEGGLSFAAQWIHDAGNVGEVFYAESLARVTDSDGIVHTAGTFVSLLERQDRWFDLDLRILDMVLSDLAGDETLVLGFNLSATSLSRSDRFADVFGRISRRPELASRLIVEVTESYPVVGASIERMKMIRALGCRIAIDDFGSGFATPASLLQVPADIVKIDAAFVWITGAAVTDAIAFLISSALPPALRPSSLSRGLKPAPNSMRRVRRAQRMCRAFCCRGRFPWRSLGATSGNPSCGGWDEDSSRLPVGHDCNP